jgi:hypothetical protein
MKRDRLLDRLKRIEGEIKPPSNEIPPAAQEVFDRIRNWREREGIAAEKLDEKNERKGQMGL